MKMREQSILLRAGFRLFRLELDFCRIRECKSAGGWGLHCNHKSKAATQRAWNELMKDDKNLEG
jgi:hypothetical protein